MNEWRTLGIYQTYTHLNQAMHNLRTEYIRKGYQTLFIPVFNASTGLWFLFVYLTYKVKQNFQNAYEATGEIRKRNNNVKHKLNVKIRIRNLNSGLYLGVPHKSKEKNTGIIQYKYEIDNSQVWYLEAQESNELMFIKNANSNLYLAVPQASNKEGLQVIQWNFATDGSQGWEIISSKNSNKEYILIKNKRTDKVLDVYKASLYNHTKIIQWKFNDQDNQYWRFETTAK